MKNSITPGKVWLDTKGKRIQAHGASMFYEDGIFYWYGENKEYTTGKNKIWHWGVRCYTSEDLYNWKDEGLIIKPVTDNPNSPLHPNQYLDRPHIIYNERTKKYVCYLKFSGLKSPHFLAVLVADRFLGPYEIVKDDLRPLDKDVGDFDICVLNGKGYIYFESNHKCLISAALTADFLDLEEDYSVHFDNFIPPFTREGPAHFERNGIHYLLTSGMLGYVPNPSTVACSDRWKGPFSVQGNAHPYDDSCSSYNSQISCVFKHPKKQDLYIAMADRWVPEFEINKERYDSLVRITSLFHKQKTKIKLRDFFLAAKAPFMRANTSIANYVWLPVKFDGEKAFIEWYDEWRVEDYN